jgi:DNA-directed RNA polymerase subunit L
MELNVIETTKKKLIFELKGADHTCCNVLKDELWNDKSVIVATYNIKHPLIGIPKFILETDGKDPKKTLLDAVARLSKKNKEFLTKFKNIK